ncbi:hypothetical protein FA95DRAFT_982110 [Auriscalpium vulgare]|uniref:Uncharacterized protein n=1 Tax=Auriscalpium vulgare TaxID=40419 RepID=A0ACB8R7E3_9AGAM|nr:hypothetical protein FA95DRAFT_982110 [Auriscalpium vulgare]
MVSKAGQPADWEVYTMRSYLSGYRDVGVLALRLASCPSWEPAKKCASTTHGAMSRARPKIAPRDVPSIPDADSRRRLHLSPAGQRCGALWPLMQISLPLSLVAGADVDLSVLTQVPRCRIWTGELATEDQTFATTKRDDRGEDAECSGAMCDQGY